MRFMSRISLLEARVRPLTLTPLDTVATNPNQSTRRRRVVVFGQDRTSLAVPVRDLNVPKSAQSSPHVTELGSHAFGDMLGTSFV